MRRLYTLGKFELLDDVPRAATLVSVQPKRLALLAYLTAATPRGFHQRDSLLGLFWPDLNQEEARGALRQALHHLRRAVGAAAIITRPDGQVGLATDALWCDLVEVERAAAEGREDEALALYGGEFLQGVFVPDVAHEFEEWRDRTQARLRAAAADAAWRLADRHERAGATAAARLAALRAHELAPDDEAALRRLLALLARSGDRTRALRLYADFASRLEREYGTRPAIETQGLADRIRALPDASDAPRRAVPAVALPVDDQPVVPPGDAGDAGGAPAPVPPVPAARRRRAGVPWLVGAGLVVLTLGYAVRRNLQSASGPPPRTLIARGALRARDRILVAQFTNHTADSTLAVAVNEALQVDLVQSPLVQVLTPDQIRGALRRMERPTEISVDDSLARALAVREGVKAFITGDVTAVGHAYELSARIVAAPSGNVLAAARETAADSTQLVAAIGRLSETMRERIGETLPSIRAAPRLALVTTASLPALRKYTQALHENEVTDDRAAEVALLEQAVAIDTGFATAWRMLGAAYGTVGEPGRAAYALQRAFAHRDRLPLRERYLTMGSYYRNVTREYDKAVAAYCALLELYPTDIAGLNNLARVLSSERDFAGAESLLTRVLVIDSTIPSVYLGLAQDLMNQGKFRDTRVVLDRAWQRFPDVSTTHLTEAYLAAAQQDWPTAERHMVMRLAASQNRPEDVMDAHLTLGEIALATGRLAEAERHLHSSMRLAAQASSPSHYLANAILLGWLELEYRGRPARALRELNDGLARYPLDSIALADRPYADIVELLFAAGDTARARAIAASVARDSLARAALDDSPRHALAGALALADHRARDAVMEYREAAAFDACSICQLPALARAYDDAQDIDGAIATYQRYIDTPWMWRFEPDAVHLGWSIERLGELYERERQPEKAAEQYTKLLALWRHADPELGPVEAMVRRRLAKLDSVAR